MELKDKFRVQIESKLKNHGDIGIDIKCSECGGKTITDNDNKTYCLDRDCKFWSN